MCSKRVDPSMSVQRRLTVPVGRELSACIVQAYGCGFTGSRALPIGILVTDRTRADSRNILRPLQASSTRAADGTRVVPVQFQHLFRRGIAELPSTAPVL